MSLSWPFKDPNEVLDYGVDWSARLAGDTIAISAFTVIAGDVAINSNTNTTSATKVWLSGGTAGTDCTILNRITTAGGRTMDQTMRLKIRDR